MMLKTPSKAYWQMSLKCYSYWQLGAIQIDLTPFTLRITVDLAKQLMINPPIYWDQYDQTAWRWICILCFTCTFRDINTTDGILTWAKVTLIKKQEGMYKKSLLYVGSTVGSKYISNNLFYTLGWNKLILHSKNGGGGRI